METVQGLDFGTLLRRWRKAAGHTQEELAERAGLSVRGISDLERGLKHRPHRDTVQLLADALQLTGQDRSTFEAAGRVLGSAFHAEPIQPPEIQLPYTEAEPATREAVTKHSGFVVRVLGPSELAHDGVPMDVSAWQPRVRSLFLLIATAPGRRRLRDELIDTLWPDSTPETGPSNLRYTLHVLRRALGSLDPSPALFEQGWISLNPAYHWEIDLERFEELAGASADDVDALERAAALYRGEPLPENRYDEWTMAVREHAERTWRELCLRLGRVYRALGSYQQAGDWLDRVLQDDPLDEEAVQEVLACLIEMGRRAEALRRYQQFERHLREELDVPPAPETAALVEGLKGRADEAPALPRTPLVTSASPRVDIAPSYPLPTTGPFVGRNAHLSRIMDVLSRLDGTGHGDVLPAQPPRLVLLAAEAGMGKTRLLGEVARRAREGDVLALAGGCYEQEGRLPYGPIHDALADYVRAQPEVLLDRIRGLETELARIVPEIRSLSADGAEGPHRAVEGERMRLFLAVAQAMERIAADTPLLLILDDLHWADDATLQLLHFLLRQPGLDRLLMLGAYRADELARDAALMELVHDSRDREKILTIDLEPLAPDDLARVLEARLSGPCASSLLAVLHARSGGNPLFALQMAALLEQEERLEQTEDGWRMVEDTPIDLPPAVRETISRRLRHLNMDQREALTLGAVLGRAFSYGALEQLWHGDERTLFEALDRTIDDHIVSETEDGYAFRHPLLWEVVYHRVPGPRRAILHERAALKLEELYGDQTEEHAAELAHHFVSAGRVHIDRALHYLRVAGDQAETGYAHAEAEGYYRRALELARQAGKVVTVAETLEKLGGVLKAMRRLDEALDVLEEAAQMYRRADDLEGEGRVVALMGLVHYFRNSFEEGIARLEPVVERLEQHGPSRSLALLYASLPRVYLPIGRFAKGLAAAERAVELARQLKDERLLPDAVFVRGRALLESGRIDEAMPVLEEAIRLAGEISDLFVLAAAYSFAAQGYFARGELNRCKAYLQRWVEVVERRGGLEQMGGLWMNAEVSLLTGDWYEVPGYMERHLAATGYDHGRLGPNGLRIRGKLSLYEGNWEQAAAYLMEYHALAERKNLAVDLLRAEALLVELDILQGQPKQALARLEPHLDRPGWKDRPDLLVPLGWAQEEAGNLAEARRTAHAAVSTARTFRPPTSDLSVNHVALLVDALRIDGMVFSRQGCRKGAERFFQEAVKLAKPMPYPYGEARALYEWGRMLAEQRELKQARPRLEEALASFRRLGARPYIERTEQALAQLDAKVT